MQKKALLKYANGKTRRIKVPVIYNFDGSITMPESVKLDCVVFILDHVQPGDNVFHYSETESVELH